MSSALAIFICRELDALDLPLPAYATDGSAGCDLYAALPNELILMPGQRALISTGLRIAFPDGYEGQIRPRSGLAVKYGLGLLNSPGTIDSDYRGVISVIAINFGQEPMTLRRGDRIAQLVIAPVLRVQWQEVIKDELPPTARHEGGFGHTGVK